MCHKMIKISQITTKENNSFDARTPQQKIMEDLDQMSKQAKKIKNKKKKGSGHLDTQLFPKWWKTHPMKAEAQTKAKAMFFEQKNAIDSYWIVQCQEQEIKLTVGELFPSKKYDINQIRSKDFGIALILRLSNGKLKEETEKLIQENKSEYHEISYEDVQDNEKIIEIVSDAIPLNDYQKNIRDTLEKKACGN